MTDWKETTETDAPDPQENLHGLSRETVETLTAEGKVNKTREKSGKSYAGIVCSNLFTFFNLIWFLVTVALVICRSTGDLMYLVVVIPNTAIAIIQECRAKHMVEKLTLASAPLCLVRRGGEEEEISGEALVPGDVMLLAIGQQVPTDCVILEGIAEANESMITGESVAIRKGVGEKLFAGSYLLSGKVVCRALHVGNENYIRTLEKQARQFKEPQSHLFRDLNRMIRYIGMFMVPLAAGMYINNYFYYRNIVQAIVKTCGSITGMIPSGIFLLVTITLTLSVTSLGRKKTLVRDSYSIEMLARADMLCLDKTGTITDGTMHVVRVELLGGCTADDVKDAVAHMQGVDGDVNATAHCLIESFGSANDWPLSGKIAFSSARKYSAASFAGHGTFTIGAPHFVRCAVTPEMETTIAIGAENGERILLLAHYPDEQDMESGELSQMAQPMALIGLADHIRETAAETIEYFQDNEVTVKVISGDHPATVSTIAKKVGLKGGENYLDCDGVSDEDLEKSAEYYSVFGRVTPEQKVILVHALRERGHVVAMTGDGVNDTLALKESDCAIAMADGSEVASRISQLVLTDSDFSALPAVVREGRRCINNVQQSSVLFLMKTVFTIVLSLVMLLTMTGYPFQPRQMWLLETFVIGLSSLLLALEPNEKRIKGEYIPQVLKRSFPSAVCLLLPVLAVLLLSNLASLSTPQRDTVCTLMLTLVGFTNLAVITFPWTRWRGTVVLVSGIGIGVALPFVTYAMDNYLQLAPFDENFVMGAALIGGVIFTIIFHIVWRIVEKKWIGPGIDAKIQKVREAKHQVKK